MRGFGPVGASPAAASIAGETEAFCVSDPIYNISTHSGANVGSLTLPDESCAAGNRATADALESSVAGDRAGYGSELHYQDTHDTMNGQDYESETSTACAAQAHYEICRDSVDGDRADGPDDDGRGRAAAAMRHAQLA